MPDQNPYAAPNANVELPIKGTPIDSIKTLPRLTTWAVVGLTIITFGIYGLYWLYSRTIKLNAVLPQESRIPNWIIIGTVVTFIISILLTIGAQFMPKLEPISTFSSYPYYILNIVWTFQFRGAINTLTDATKRGDTFWLGPILTFFINIFYFQYRINQIHDTPN